MPADQTSQTAQASLREGNVKDEKKGDDGRGGAGGFEVWANGLQGAQPAGPVSPGRWDIFLWMSFVGLCEMVDEIWPTVAESKPALQYS